ncbi:MAG: hypothetical protein AB1499_17295 [Nitrospirota bacterium]
MKRAESENKQSGGMNTVRFLLVLAVVFVVSWGGSFFYFKNKFAFDSAFLADIEARQDRKAAEKAEKESGRLYENGKATGIRDETVLRQDEQLIAAEDVIRRQIEPYKVRLIDLYMDNEGVIYIDLGEEIKRNFSGGVRDELGLIAGLYKGIKAVVPGCTALRFLVQSSEAESLGGHIDISRPVGDEIEEYL